MTELEKAIQETAETALGMLKKSQMAFDFSAPKPDTAEPKWNYSTSAGEYTHPHYPGVVIEKVNSSRYDVRNGNRSIMTTRSLKDAIAHTERTQQPHHNTAYHYTNDKGTVVNVAAKGAQTNKAKGVQPAAEPAPRPTWDSDAAVNDTKDIKRRLVAAGFKASEWSARADIVRSGARKGEIGDAIISYKYPLDAAQVVARTDSLLDAGFDVTWNTTKLANGKRIIHPTIDSVGRRGELKILDADKPAGQRITKYASQAEAEAALTSF